MAVGRRHVPQWLYFLALILILGAAVALLLHARLKNIDEYTRNWVVRELSLRFDSEIDPESLHVQIWPSMTVTGQGLAVHYHNRSDVPPLIRVQDFAFDVGVMGIIRPVTRIRSIVLNDMVITIPPRTNEGNKNPSPRALAGPMPRVVIDRIICNHTTIHFLSSKPGKDPLEFDVHNLLLNNVGARKPFEFLGNLTNAKPKGEIATTGKFGPWDVDQPGNTPVSGEYEFTDANLDPFPGIGGTLSSAGHYHGPLDNLAVDGKTDTPNFSIDPVGRGVPLHTDFSATVDGTEGDTFLHPVRAVLGQSVIIANGSVVLQRASHGHLITLDVDAPAAQLADILELAMKSDTPPLTGTIKLHTKLVIPPFKAKAIDKLLLDGDFEANAARFSSADIRKELTSLSRHALGEQDDPNAGSAVSDLKGHFHVEKAVATFTHLKFSVAGAAVLLEGSYKLHGGELDFHGHLQMRASLSDTMTGAKAVLLKPLDPFFKKGKSGTDLPITITGTRENPVFGVSIFHKTFKKEMREQERR